MDRETWLLWMLADSQLPTGGFVASAGLEAAVQGGLVRESAAEDNIDSFVGFISDSAHNQARFALPICSRVHDLAALHLMPLAKAGDGSSGNGSDDEVVATKVLEDIVRIDGYHHAMLASNQVAMRASIAQGGGLLSVFNRGYALSAFMGAGMARRAWGLRGSCSGWRGWARCLRAHAQLFMFQFVRQVFSAAIRLNLVGPLRAQMLSCDMQRLVSSLLDHHAHRRVELDSIEDLFGESAVYTEPVLELYQGMHDRLYSRIFNS
ncbi:hypothetical protein BX661DRAFT_222680 [Kickxella alabastrina]|uniref:uncharacterized protein n=1 Tax=Kickxella alabastrina TaxID=61397 RepID=UPI00221F67D1|nr:uncharacterized protein BX661DRAFT_222680 [Kickxella alabastrina]KAI7833884.1 hypothetical protein BX661DRAFT_222680 [Kickxella alabastrina]